MEAADCLSFTEAASKLNISQPALSRQIASLEEELGYPLFLRIKQRVFLSEAGKAYLGGVKKLFREYRDLVAEVDRIHGSGSRVLKIGYLEDRSLHPSCSDAIAAMSEKYPDVSIKMEACRLKELLEKIGEKRIDIGFTLEFDLGLYPDIESKSIEKTKNYLAIPRSHPKADRKDLTLADFADETFVTIDPGESADIVSRLTESCREAGFVPNLKYAPTLRELVLWVEAGLGISGLDKGCFLYNNPRFKFLTLPEIHPFDSVVVWNRDNLTETGASFLNAVLSGTGKSSAQ